MSERLTGQIAIVTGAESGIGAATARALGAEGCSVAINYVKSEDDANAVRDAVIQSGARAIVVKGDVSNEDDVGSLFSTCANELGKPTILINSAGVNGQTVEVADMTADQWDATLGANLRGPFLTSRAFIRERRTKREPARIVNVSSIHEDVVVLGYADYDASKAGLLALSRTLAVEAAPHNITVNCVAPGMILTPMNADAQDDPNEREEKSQHIPLKRPGKPEEVAALIVFLCTSDAAYITGTSLRIDGGLSLNTGQGA
jgi:glucose 1-dehydrogenase